LGPLGYPLLEGLEDPSPTFGGPPPLASTMVIMSVATLYLGIIPSQPHPSVATGLPLDRVVPSWASKAGWKPMPKRSHSPLGKENNFPWDSKILEIYPYFHQYPSVNRKFLV